MCCCLFLGVTCWNFRQDVVFQPALSTSYTWITDKDLAWQAVSTGKRVHMERLDHHLEQFARAELLRTEGFKAYFAVPLILER